ncbi:MAG TPA: response regulator, partial [Polyangiaceae bacterium]|nr:response regulator [Polyangiaceae bacterium]
MNKRILIVDDEFGLADVVAEILTDQGYEASIAINGRLGLAQIAETHPGLILLDVMMPVLDGFEACTALRRLQGGERVPVLMMTGLDDVDSIKRVYEVGATDFITKPIAWPMLSHRVTYMLRAN